MCAVRSSELSMDMTSCRQLGKWKMTYVCKKKAWTKLLMGLFEILIVNINILKKSSVDKTTGDVFRWKLVMSMVKKEGTRHENG